MASRRSAMAVYSERGAPNGSASNSTRRSSRCSGCSQVIAMPPCTCSAISTPRGPPRRRRLWPAPPRRGAPAESERVHRPGRVPHRAAAGLDEHRGIGEHVRQRLVGTDDPAELATLARVLHRHGQRALGQAQLVRRQHRLRQGDQPVAGRLVERVPADQLAGIADGRRQRRPGCDPASTCPLTGGRTWRRSTPPASTVSPCVAPSASNATPGSSGPAKRARSAVSSTQYRTSPAGKLRIDVGAGRPRARPGRGRPGRCKAPGTAPRPAARPPARWRPRLRPLSGCAAMPSKPARASASHAAADCSGVGGRSRIPGMACWAPSRAAVAEISSCSRLRRTSTAPTSHPLFSC